MCFIHKYIFGKILILSKAVLFTQSIAVLRLDIWCKASSLDVPLCNSRQQPPQSDTYFVIGHCIFSSRPLPR